MEPTNKAKYPVKEFCPKESSKINAQATTGIFLEIEAVNLASELKARFTLVVVDPISPKNIEITAAVVVAAIDMKIVSNNLSSILGSRVSVSCDMSMLEKIQYNAAGNVVIPCSALKSVMMEDA